MKPVVEHQRRFSLEEDFMNYKTDDLLYTFMRTLSTARPEEGKVNKEGKPIFKEYLPKKDFLKHKGEIAGICGCSTKTIDRHIEKLFENDLLEEGVEIVKDGDKEYQYKCYWFPYDENGKYKILDKDFIRYLIDTRNAQCIRVYLYLLNKYQYKKNYTFTYKEILIALGYSPDTSTTSISNIIDSFCREGILEVEDKYDYIEKHGEIHKIPVKELQFVATKLSQLPQAISSSKVKK